MGAMIQLEDPVLDATDPYTRMFLLAEHWRNKCAELMTQRPDWKGYALLGDPAKTGGYVMEHSAAPPDPELGAEFIIRPATQKDREGNRQVGESRKTDGSPIQPEVMAIRIGFLNAAGLDALEAQLRVLREENFPDSIPSRP
jgi:hypothetical protein